MVTSFGPWIGLAESGRGAFFYIESKDRLVFPELKEFDGERLWSIATMD